MNNLPNPSFYVNSNPAQLLNSLSEEIGAKDLHQRFRSEGLPIQWLFVNIGPVNPIKYTKHAKNRMRWHRITEKEVESALKFPEFLQPSAESRLNAWMKSSNKFLRVTYKEESDRFLVISAVKKNKGWR